MGKAKIGKETTLGNNVLLGDDVIIGRNVRIENSVEIGIAHLDRPKQYYKKYPVVIGDNCIIRSGAIIYPSCLIGDGSWIGNYAIIRENTIIGRDTTIGAHVMNEGYSTFGNHVKIYSFCELGGNMVVEDHVFIGPGVVTANNPKPVINRPTNYRWDDGQQKVIDIGPIIRRGAKIGINATLLSFIEIGMDALVAAGSVVTKDVPDFAIVKGIPAKVVGEVPEHERVGIE